MFKKALIIGIQEQKEREKTEMREKILQAALDIMGNRFPTKPIAFFLMLLGAALGLMWLGKIAPSLLSSAIPSGLGQYTTLVIQAMDRDLLYLCLGLRGLYC